MGEEHKLTETNEGSGSGMKPIYIATSKSKRAEDRFKMTPSEYLEKYKVGVYLQDAIKIILDRWAENPNQIMLQ